MHLNTRGFLEFIKPIDLNIDRKLTEMIMTRFVIILLHSIISGFAASCRQAVRELGKYCIKGDSGLLKKWRNQQDVGNRFKFSDKDVKRQALILSTM